MLEILKEKEKGTIVFVKLGTFYVAVGEDAVLVHKLLDLKCTCFNRNKRRPRKWQRPSNDLQDIRFIFRLFN